MTRRRSADKEARAMQAGCNAVTDQFARLRAGIVAELAKCPDGERRAGLMRTLERTDQEIAIMQRIAANARASNGYGPEAIEILRREPPLTIKRSSVEIGGPDSKPDKVKPLHGKQRRKRGETRGGA